MPKKRTVQDILEHPPTKKVKCSRCGGSGIINRRGMIMSDDCPDCHKEDGFYGGTNTGKVEVQDYKETEKLIRETIKRKKRKGNDKGKRT